MIKLKIWYVDGAYEEVPGTGDETYHLSTIYAEASSNGRVVAAELHREDGSVAASFDHRAPVAPQT